MNYDETLKQADAVLADIANALKNYREGQQKSQRQMAQEFGITQSFLSKLESGTYNPNIRTLVELTAAAGGTFSLEMDLPKGVNKRAEGNPSE